MSLPDPNATAPESANEQLAGATDEIEKKRIELKSMLSTSFVASELQKRCNLSKFLDFDLIFVMIILENYLIFDFIFDLISIY